MGYRKFKADRLFDGSNLQDNSAVLITDDEGKIETIISMDQAGDDVNVYSGILSPGFINCHCHLELSHLKDVIPPGTGLIAFLKSVVQKRGFDADIIQDRIERAEQEMYDNGIVAIGDISNQEDAIRVKSKSKIRWQNFIEVLSMSDEKAEANIDHYKKVLAAYIEQLPPPHRSVLSPHASYTVSSSSFKLISESTANQIISIHNQEHPAEDELYKTGKGEFLELLGLFGFTNSPFPVTQLTSLRSYLPYFNRGQKLFLVHNTYMPAQDISFAKKYASQHGLSIVFCLCPNANLYIENKLPPVTDLIQQGCDIVLGTDSYSSNWQLSIAKEMQALKQAPFFNNIEPDDALKLLLKWATINGATALNWEDELGSFEKGKRPGIVLIENDLSSSKRLL
ncbi:MAG TPA: amidohydrolase family protein [Chitinophagaceae bacterium]|nr:amidohydrolase family protein [Chitinophagaceae bacterium]